MPARCASRHPPGEIRAAASAAVSLTPVSPHRHIVSLASVTVIAANLLFWVLPLVVMATLRLLLPLPAVARALQTLTAAAYRTAVRVDTFWLQRVLGIRLLIDGQAPAVFPPGSVIVANHQSWFDILVLQWLISREGPMIRFLIKRQLVYVPIVGWICLLLGFPRLYRGGGQPGRDADYRTVGLAASALGAQPGVLLVFPEGTRFTAARQRARGAGYRHLLKPRAGGLGAMRAALPAHTPVFDITLGYDADRTLNFWKHLAGMHREVRVTVARFAMGEIDDARAWLNARWVLKDAWLDANAGTTG